MNHGCDRVQHLDIAMDESELVERRDGGQHLGEVEDGMVMDEDAVLHEEGAHVASRNVFHGEIDMLRVLKGIEQAHHPFTLGGGEDNLFVADVADLVVAAESSLGHALDGTHFTRVFLLAEEDLAVAAAANLGEDGKVEEAHARAAHAQHRALLSKVPARLGFALFITHLRIHRMRSRDELQEAETGRDRDRDRVRVSE
jgi:hypothetical protein